jgi:hypothetical protein
MTIYGYHDIPYWYVVFTLHWYCFSIFLVKILFFNIYFTFFDLFRLFLFCFKNLWCNKQGNCPCKMAGTGIRAFAKLCSQMLRIARTRITPWQTALKWTADCQAPRSGCQDYMHSGQACGNPLSNWYFFLWQFAVQLFYSWPSAVQTLYCGLQQSAVHIWARNLARDWIPAPAILQR